MAATHVAVHCRLPHGIVLSDPQDHHKRVELNGINKATIVGANYGTTMVPDTFWEKWFSANKDTFGPLKTGAIYVANNAKDAAAMGKEFSTIKTGLEPLKADDYGVKPVTKDDRDGHDAAA